MAAAAARSFMRSTTTARSVASRAASRPAPALLPMRRPSSPSPRLLLRSPVEMSSARFGCLLPMHNATASALMTSLLAAPARRGFAWLSEDG